jgi:hypothetical protein
VPPNSRISNDSRSLQGCLLSQIGEPSIQDRQATRLNRSERDPHPAVVPRIGYLALSHEVDARVRNPQSDLRSSWERSSSFDKTSKDAQILDMRCQLLLRHNVRDLNSGNELETLRAMPFKINRWATSTPFGFYSTGVAGKTNESRVDKYRDFTWANQRLFLDLVNNLGWIRHSIAALRATREVDFHRRDGGAGSHFQGIAE